MYLKERHATPCRVGGKHGQSEELYIHHMSALSNEPPALWQMKQNRRSPRYTTRWDELMVVSA